MLNFGFWADTGSGLSLSKGFPGPEIQTEEWVGLVRHAS